MITPLKAQPMQSPFKKWGLCALKSILALVFTLTVIPLAFAQGRELALTIDDLPFVGESKNFHLNLILDALKGADIPATGFVIAKEVTASTMETLKKFHGAGLTLGNHTRSHANLNNMSSQAYINDIASADVILSELLTRPKFFRYPYLVMGEGQKKENIKEYLSSQHYLIAPVTVDSKDFVFNQLLLSVPEKERRQFLTVLKPCYLDFIWQQTMASVERSHSSRKPEQPQILLIHANLLNAYVLPDLIALFKQNGFTFIPLAHALKPDHRGPKPETTPEKAKIVTHTDAYMAWD
ncbi:MAG: polysaccharide deacetylase family protein [Legionellales bacterium]|nr:polysaccharide deacetylase family protein [Legionellales bacterium]